jgi:molybdate transport system regulatory protein
MVRCGMAIVPSRSTAAPRPATRVSIRLDLASGARVGPGKIALLEEIARHGSISAAGRALRMSYRRAWELVEDLNRHLGTPVVAAVTGGSGGGGARLTAEGAALVAAYRAIEQEAAAAAAPYLATLPGARAEG